MSIPPVDTVNPFSTSHNNRQGPTRNAALNTVNEPFITRLRNSRQGMRWIASMVVFFFCTTFYSTVVHAAYKKVDELLQDNSPPAFFTELATTVKHSTATVNHIGQQLKQPGFKQGDWGIQQQQLQAHIDQLQAVHQDVLDYFADRQARYQSLPASRGLNNNDQQQAQYEQTMAALQSALQHLQQQTDKQGAARALVPTQTLLATLAPRAPVYSYDGDQPFGPLASESRDALYTQAELEAQLGITISTTTPDTPVSADLVGNGIDVVITPAIQAKADELGGDAADIYNWVYNTIRFIPSYGSIQGAEQTLQLGAGNAADIASLLIALLRAAGISARYQYGTIQLTVEEVMNWVGGVHKTAAAHNLLSQGGIPNRLVKVNGKDTYFELEHVWVQAWLSGQWRDADPSFKQYTYSDGIDLIEQVPFDVETLATGIADTAIVNEDEGWVQSINQALIETQLSDYQTQLEDYLTNQLPDATVGDVLGDQTIIERTAGYFPVRSHLPYQTIFLDFSLSELPESIRHQFRFELLSEDGTTTLLTKDIYTAVAVGKKLAMSFDPATPADAQTLLDYFPDNPQSADELPSEIPAGLFNVKGQFTVDQVVEAESVAISFGQVLQTRKGFWTPRGGWQLTTNPILTGEYQAVGMDLHGMSAKQLDELTSALENTQAQFEVETLSGLSKHDVVGDLMQATIMSYQAMTRMQALLMARSSDIVYYREPSYGTFQTKAQLTYLFNLPHAIRMTGLLMDYDSMKSSSECKMNCWGKWRQFNESSGQMLSAYEHIVPEQLFSTDENPIEGISAVKALAIASQQGQRIYTFTQDNFSYLSDITIDQAIRDEIQTQVQNGMVVTVHQNPITYAGWTGTGYSIVNPDTGAGGYKISGGSDGSQAFPSEQIIPSSVEWAGVYDKYKDIYEKISGVEDWDSIKSNRNRLKEKILDFNNHLKELASVLEDAADSSSVDIVQKEYLLFAATGLKAAADMFEVEVSGADPIRYTAVGLAIGIYVLPYLSAVFTSLAANRDS